LPATAALQLLRSAADVFDDIEDADNTESVPAKYGIALAANTASQRSGCPGGKRIHTSQGLGGNQ